MIVSILKIFALICTAIICGKISTKLKLTAILGWLIAGIAFGPYLAGIVTADTTYAHGIKFGASDISLAPTWHPLRESNTRLTLRRGLLYPLN